MVLAIEYPVENKTSNVATRKVFVSLLPVENQHCIGGFSERKSGTPQNDGVHLSSTAYVPWNTLYKLVDM